MSYGRPLTESTNNNPIYLSPSKSTALDALFYWLTYSRGASAMISALATLLMLITVNSFLGYENKEHTDLGNNLIFSAITIITLLNFVGMATSSSFSQGYRLNQTIGDIKENKFTLSRVPALIFGSTTIYALLLGYNTQGSFTHLPSALAENFQLEVPPAVSKLMLGLGLLSGSGYSLATINYNNSATEARLREVRRGFAPNISPSQYFWFITANIIPQVALNSFITYNTINANVPTTGLNATYTKLGASIFINLLTIPGIWSSQISSFVKNTQLKDGGILNIAKQAGNRPIYLPRTLGPIHASRFRILVNLTNFSAFLIAVQSSNALATIPSIFFSLNPTIASHKAIYFTIFGGSFFFSLINAGNYMAFNTVIAMNALFFYLEAKTFPNVKQMTYLEALQKLQAKYDEYDSAKQNLINQAWAEIKPNKAKLAEITAFIRGIENKLGLFDEKTALNAALTPFISNESSPDLTNLVDTELLRSLTTLSTKIDESIKNLKIDSEALSMNELKNILTKITNLCPPSTPNDSDLLKLKIVLTNFIEQLDTIRTRVAVESFFEILIKEYANHNGLSVISRDDEPPIAVPIQDAGVTVAPFQTVTSPNGSLARSNANTPLLLALRI